MLDDRFEGIQPEPLATRLTTLRLKDPNSPLKDTNGRRLIDPDSPGKDTNGLEGDLCLSRSGHSSVMSGQYKGISRETPPGAIDAFESASLLCKAPSHRSRVATSATLASFASTPASATSHSLMLGSATSHAGVARRSRRDPASASADSQLSVGTRSSEAADLTQQLEALKKQMAQLAAQNSALQEAAKSGVIAEQKLVEAQQQLNKRTADFEAHKKKAVAARSSAAARSMSDVMSRGRGGSILSRSFTNRSSGSGSGSSSNEL
jgi:hypothetical protein